MSKVIAILTSDIHLSHKPPVARSSEDDWYAAMARTLDQVLDISNEHTAPLIIAGDLFDRWNSQPELINFAIGSFRAFQHGVYAIPGQHDLPYHDYTEIHKSAYYTLVKAGVIIDIQPSSYGHHSSTKDITFWSFPWSFDVFSIDNDEGLREIKTIRGKGINLAVVHSYVYLKGGGYPGAPEEQNLRAYLNKLKGYDVAMFGDNHMAFRCEYENHPVIINCGTLMRRRSDEIDYTPMVGLLHDDGEVHPHYLDLKQDKILATPEVVVRENLETDLSKFLTELKSLGADSLDYTTAVTHYMDYKAIADDVRKVVLESIEADE